MSILNSIGKAWGYTVQATTSAYTKVCEWEKKADDAVRRGEKKITGGRTLDECVALGVQQMKDGYADVRTTTVHTPTTTVPTTPTVQATSTDWRYALRTDRALHEALRYIKDNPYIPTIQDVHVHMEAPVPQGVPIPQRTSMPIWRESKPSLRRRITQALSGKQPTRPVVMATNIMEVK